MCAWTSQCFLCPTQVGLLGTLVARAVVSAAFWAMFYTEGVTHAWAWALFLYTVSVGSALVVDMRRRKAFLSARQVAAKPRAA